MALGSLVPGPKPVGVSEDCEESKSLNLSLVVVVVVKLLG